MSVSHTISACPLVLEQVLVLQAVTKCYGKERIVDDVSLTVGKGEIFGLLGPNGAGKTTLMRMIVGLSRPSTGAVNFFVNGQLAVGSERNRFVGLVPQENNLERELTVVEALTVYANLFAVPKKRVEQVIDEFKLQTFRTKNVGHLSGGMARRVLIARALLPEPQLLLLDEPTVGLDPDVRQDIWQLVRDLAASGKTVVMTTHYMDEADQLCHKIALLKQGRIMKIGSPQALKLAAGSGSAATLETVFLQLVRGGLD